MRREWTVVTISPTYAAVLAAWEVPVAAGREAAYEAVISTHRRPWSRPRASSPASCVPRAWRPPARSSTCSARPPRGRPPRLPMRTGCGCGRWPTSTPGAERAAPDDSAVGAQGGLTVQAGLQLGDGLLREERQVGRDQRDAQPGDAGEGELRVVGDLGAATRTRGSRRRRGPRTARCCRAGARAWAVPARRSCRSARPRDPGRRRRCDRSTRRRRHRWCAHRSSSRGPTPRRW